MYRLIFMAKNLVVRKCPTVVVDAERHQRQLHVHAEPELRGVTLRQPALDAHLVAELHEADAVGLERLVGFSARERLLRQEFLRRPGPERSVARQQVLLHLRDATARTRRLRRERHRSTTRTSRADQLRLLGRPREDVGGEWDLRHGTLL
jgi:hypothetical protein